MRLEVFVDNVLSRRPRLSRLCERPELPRSRGDGKPHAEGGWDAYLERYYYNAITPTPNALFHSRLMPPSGQNFYYVNDPQIDNALDRIAGLVFGECTDCKPGDGYGSLTLEQILDDHVRPLGIPAYRGAMIGHIREQFIVPVGGRVEMDADAGSFRLLEPVFAA